MADLTIAPASGSQDTTQNPQSVTSQTVGASTKSAGVQPGTAATLLTNQGGVSLHSTQLTAVSLAAGTQTQSQPAAQPAQRHINSALLGASILFCLVAVGLFWTIHRSAKNTTKYQ
jgi:hypothetical protein